VRPNTDLGLSCEPEHGCITCGDEAVPLRVVRVDANRGLALCEDDAGERTTIEVALIDPVAPGDALLAHAGTAISNLPAKAGPAQPDRSRETTGQIVFSGHGAESPAEVIPE
jgi:hydrogenase assembly chaperone HypC/HupF